MSGGRRRDVPRRAGRAGARRRGEVAPPEPRRAERGLGGDHVEGRRAVVELLRAERRRVRSVLVSREVDPDDVVDEIVELAGTTVRFVSPEQLAGAARTDAPQGVVARADPIPEADLDALLAEPAAFLVALDGVTDPRNLGAVMRSAETAGATGVVLSRHRSARLTPAAMKAAAGAAEHLPVARVGGIPAALDRVRRAQVWAIGLDEAGDRDIGDVEIATEPLLLVLGAEGGGLAALTKRRCDVLARIPTHGHVASLNVAAAAAVACHEIARRRAESTR